MNPNDLKISLLANSEVLVLRKKPESRIFISTQDSVVISKNTLLAIIHYLKDCGSITDSELAEIMK